MLHSLFLISILCATVCFSKHKHPLNMKMRLDPDAANPRPIIGIISETVPAQMMKEYKWAQSALHDSYCSFVEMGGARVVPVLINRDDDYYQHKFSSLNGLLIAGEDVNLANQAFTHAVSVLVQLAIQANKNNDYFPIIGIGAGFAALTNELAGTPVTSPCLSENTALPLTMTKDFTTSRLFKDIPVDVNESITTQPVTFNNHSNCLFPKDVNGTLGKLIHILSTNKDSKDLEFVSTYETINYPFYAFQWNPALNPFEWSPDLPNIPHTYQAVRVSQYFANFFDEEARNSAHHFTDPYEELFSLVWHYQLYYVTNVDTPIKVMYLFKNNTK